MSIGHITCTHWRLVEPCCGSAALTLHLLGSPRGVLPYQGSKWRFRRALGAVLEARGFVGAPSEVVFSDTGPWPTVLRSLLVSQEERHQVIVSLEKLAARDPREAYDMLQGLLVAAGSANFAAQFLFLQRLAFSGKAVGIKDMHWASPGFNKTSAYGKASTEVFGAIKPQVPSLIALLESFDEVLAPVQVHGWTLPIHDLVRRGLLLGSEMPTVVYLDPPYESGTSYPNGHLTRAEVVDIARWFHHQGYTVIVSEAGAVAELVALGWTTEQLYAGRGDTSPFRGKQQEWITVSPKLAPVGLLEITPDEYTRKLEAHLGGPINAWEDVTRLKAFEAFEDGQLLDELERRRVERLGKYAVYCTGVSAGWCPVCGTCTCEDRQVSLADRGCPLHDPSSPHAPLGPDQDVQPARRTL